MLVRALHWTVVLRVFQSTPSTGITMVSNYSRTHGVDFCRVKFSSWPRLIEVTAERTSACKNRYIFGYLRQWMGLVLDAVASSVSRPILIHSSSYLLSPVFQTNTSLFKPLLNCRWEVSVNPICLLVWIYFAQQHTGWCYISLWLLFRRLFSIYSWLPTARHSQLFLSLFYIITHTHTTQHQTMHQYFWRHLPNKPYNQGQPSLWNALPQGIHCLKSHGH